ncbi:MAG: hypothetical protein EOO21_00690, partial [Comamonadaceae bacterium]
MPSSPSHLAGRGTSADARRAPPDVLGLALMDSRNQTLALLSAWDEALGATGAQVPMQPDLELPQWLAG